MFLMYEYRTDDEFGAEFFENLITEFNALSIQNSKKKIHAYKFGPWKNPKWEKDLVHVNGSRKVV